MSRALEVVAVLVVAVCVAPGAVALLVGAGVGALVAAPLYVAAQWADEWRGRAPR